MSAGQKLRDIAFASGVVCMGASGTAVYFNQDVKAQQQEEASSQTAANKVLTESCPMPSNDFEPACKPGSQVAIGAATQKLEAARDRAATAKAGYGVSKEIAIDTAGGSAVAALIAAALAGARRKDKPQKNERER